MIIWTIQSEKAFLTLKKKGVLYANGKYCDKDWLIAYKWMSSQMEKRSIIRPQKAQLPLWGWFQYTDSTHKVPDLKNSGFCTRGNLCYRIMLNLENSSVLLSDFEKWHYVLNNWYLPKSYLEKTKEKTDKEITESWDRIFDLAPSSGFYDNAMDIVNGVPIQATFWEIKWNSVLKYKSFIAK